MEGVAVFCGEHSGNCEAIEGLKGFRAKQEDINVRIFTKLDEIAAKQNKISGAWTAVCFIAGIIATLLCGYLVRHF